MNPAQKKQAEWQVMRERLHIADSAPPRPQRAERDISAILPDILKSEKPEEIYLPEAVSNHWKLIAGTQIAEHSAPEKLRGGVLTVYVDHPGWLTEIRRLPKKNLLKKIASIPGVPPVEDIRFQLDPNLRNGKFRPK